MVAFVMPFRRSRRLGDSGQGPVASMVVRMRRRGPREAILACIVVYTDAVVELPDDAIERLRGALAR